VRHEPFDLALASGGLRAHRSGPPGGGLVLCVPGLSSNGRAFDHLAERLADEGHLVVALDLRGRGLSAATAAGTYGWPAHARDVLEAAGLLSDAPVDVVGHSMGAFVAMQAVALAPGGLRRLVLVDAVGPPEPQTVATIRRAVERLGAVYPSADEYIDRVRQVGSVVPWSERWERAFRYELVDVEGGVRTRTDRSAVLEDLAYGEAHDPRELWADLAGPALLVRSALPILPGQGFVVSAADRNAFIAHVPGAEVVEIDANHYGVMTHEATASAIARFLR
jgi:pimeloyl-ACP methyl ester carboxylesterase